MRWVFFESKLIKKAAQSYSPTLKSAVPLPQTGLTSEFGMGSGISPSQSAQPKRKNKKVTVQNKEENECPTFF